MMVDQYMSHRATRILLASWPWGTTDHCRSPALLTLLLSARSCPGKPTRNATGTTEKRPRRTVCRHQTRRSEDQFFGPMPSFRLLFGSDSERTNPRGHRNPVPDVRSGSRAVVPRGSRGGTASGRRSVRQSVETCADGGSLRANTGGKAGRSNWGDVTTTPPMPTAYPKAIGHPAGNEHVARDPLD